MKGSSDIMRLADPVMLITREIDGVKYARADEVARELRELKKTKLEQEQLIAHLRNELQNIALMCQHLSTVEAKAKNPTS